ncbi:hypothetical protein BC828DRAFT_394351 [Blastocladiella britannica]|nr:hypothetical protein BC828DRAFT_394351 [Blastocladiella britannica]
MIDHVASRILAHAAGSTSSPEESLTILNVLLRHDSVLAAVLSRGFKEFSPPSAIKHGYAVRLLPCYPRLILVGTLKDTITSAAKFDALPALVKLWELAGPKTVGRAVWLMADSLEFLETAVRHGRLSILEWFDGVARAANITVPWSEVSWENVAVHGHVTVLCWALERRYLDHITPDYALLSASTGDITLLEQWIASQPSKVAAMAVLTQSEEYETFFQTASVATLDWWWIRLADSSQLPEPDMLVLIFQTSLCGKDMAVVEWWWSRFLAHKTPQHTCIGSVAILRHGWGLSLEGAQWLWRHSHYTGTNWDADLKAFEFASDWHDVRLPMAAFRSQKPTLALLEWWVAKCIVMKRKLSISSSLIGIWARTGQVEALTYLIHSPKDQLEIDWGEYLVAIALHSMQLNVLQWWDAYCDKLPPQQLDCSSYLQYASIDDANVLEWWHARFFASTPADDWQAACTSAIVNNARAVQQWLCSRPNVYSQLKTPTYCGPRATIYTLEFMDKLGSEAMPSSIKLERVLWKCMSLGTSVNSVVPLSPEQWTTVADNIDILSKEWWLRLHLAAGHPIVFPPNKRRFSRAHGAWLHDVVVARKIPVLMQSDSDPTVLVPFKLANF